MQATFEAVPSNGTGRELERMMESVAIRAAAGFPLQLCCCEIRFIPDLATVVTYGPAVL